MKKIYILVFALIALTANTFAQNISRSNSELPKLKEELSSINKSNGWKLKSDGQWAKAIPIHDYSSIPSHNNDQPKFKIQIANAENFKKISFKEISYNGKNYYILLIKKASGSYKYKAIKEDWRDYDKLLYYVIEEKPVFSYEINKSKTIEFDIVVSSFLSENFETMTDERLVSSISSVMKSRQRDQFNDCIAFDIFPVEIEGVKSMRFNFRNYNYGDKKRCIDYGDKCDIVFGKYSSSKPKFNPLIFDEKYFECPLKDFESLFQL